MSPQAEIFKRLVQRLSVTAPEAAEKVLAAEKAFVKERARESGSVATLVGKELLEAVSPRASAAVERAREKAYTKARAADVSVSEHLARVPGLGALFRTRERVPVRTIGEVDGRAVREIVEVPGTSLVEPIEKAKRVAVPVLAFVGLTSLTRGEGDRDMEPKFAQILKAASETVKKQQSEIELRKIAMQKLATQADDLMTQIETHDLEKAATDFALDLLRREHITVDQFKTKVAQLVSGGREKLEIEKKALEYIEKGASRLGVAEPGVDDDESTISSLPNDPLTEYLMQYASEPTAQASNDD